jgi:hypothetical protein
MPGSRRPPDESSAVFFNPGVRHGVALVAPENIIMSRVFTGKESDMPAPRAFEHDDRVKAWRDLDPEQTPIQSPIGVFPKGTGTRFRMPSCRRMVVGWPPRAMTTQLGESHAA